MSISDILTGEATLITGIEQDPDEPEFDRVYIGARYNWQYCLVKHGSVQFWNSGHTFTRLDPKAVVYEDTERRDAARAPFSDSGR